MVLQECSRPLSQDKQGIWFETIPTKGVAALANPPWTVKQGVTGATESGVWIYPVEIYGPESFHLLAVWAQRKPTYVQSILADLDRHAEFIEAKPTIIIGDFNSAPELKSGRANSEHQVLEARLTELGLVNAVKGFFGRFGTAALPTHYLYRKEERAYHLDYCFVPHTWLPRVVAAEIGTYSAWKDESDHCPILVELKEQNIL